ncbi:hypothetical protein CTM_25878 [Clostridium tetanomorphum DSM 665]|nr:hypothetical protein CTM_25878 [Clostridium tetanomorphum DSM 665]
MYKDIYRGVELPDGFNDILKDVDKYEENPDEKKRPMYKNKILRSYILKSRYWYQLVHDIRTEETHYGMGDLEIENDKVMYHNLKRSNRNGGKGKEKGEKEEKEIRFHISEINGIYAEFCNYINELDKLILTI